MKPLNKRESGWLLTVREHKHFVSHCCPYARRQCRKARRLAVKADTREALTENNEPDRD